MIEIKDLLLHFNHILLSEEVKKQAIKNILQKVLNIKIENKNIIIKNNVVFLNIKPIYKNEILIQKEKINIFLKESLGKKAPINIR